MQQYEVRDALAGVEAVQVQMAERVGYVPFWRHAAVGGLMTQLIGLTSISISYQIVGTVLILAGGALVVRWDMRTYGVFISGYRKGATLLTLALFGAFVPLVIAAAVMREYGFSPWNTLALAAIAFVFGTAASAVQQRVYRRRELTRTRQ